MATKKKMLQAAAGNAGGAGLNVEDVFSTYLYTGNDSTQTITNGIDLDGEGGLVWIKGRSSAKNNALYDTERGVNQYLYSNSTLASTSGTNMVTAFNSDGFSIGSNALVNEGPITYASWTFRKAPKFFDVVTYTGDGTARTISHNLGSVPGCIIIKNRTTANRDWAVYHRGANASSPEDYPLTLNTTDQAYNNDWFNDTAPTSSVFSVKTNSRVNTNGDNYVAYLFAHNNGDGEFGPDGDADIIKCGSYTGNGTKLDINLGFEAQWVLVKRTDTSGYDWHLFDVMRGMPVGSDAKWLEPNTSAVEGSNQYMSANSNGFTLPDGHPEVCASGGTYIYIAIRRGTKVPESATEVFAIDTRASSGTNVEPAYRSPFPVDMAIVDRPVTSASTNRNVARLIGDKFLRTDATAAAGSYTTVAFDNMNGISDSAFSSPDTNRLSWMWKRAPGYFDGVAYSGNGVAGHTVSHNLGVEPEMIIIKDYNNTRNWIVGLQFGASSFNYGLLNSTQYISGSGYSNSTEFFAQPTSTSFSLGTSVETNNSIGKYVAYLFATLAGISKVGSYTGNGSSQTINCGFTNGARFILVKRSNSSGDWYIWDSLRGIVAGNDPHLSLNTTAAQVTSDDSVDPDNSGFIVNQVSATNINVSSASYIFYAIA